MNKDYLIKNNQLNKNIKLPDIRSMIVGKELTKEQAKKLIDFLIKKNTIELTLDFSPKEPLSMKFTKETYPKIFNGNILKDIRITSVQNIYSTLGNSSPLEEFKINKDGTGIVIFSPGFLGFKKKDYDREGRPQWIWPNIKPTEFFNDSDASYFHLTLNKDESNN